MQTKTALLASSAVAALGLAAPADAAGNFYVSVYGGANWLQDSSFADSAVTGVIPTTPTTSVFAFANDADTGFIVGGAVGMSLNQFMQGLRVEAEVGYRQQNVNGVFSSAIITTVGGPTTPSTSAYGLLDYDHSTLSVMANVWYDFNVGGVTPYIGGGIGWAQTEVEGNYLVTGPGAPGAVPFSFDDNGFAWQVGAGVNFDIAPNMKLGVGYRYFEGPEVTILAPGATTPAPANLLTGEVDDQNHSVLVNLTIGL
jgi:OmpA-OmpF porin, OOP family